MNNMKTLLFCAFLVIKTICPAQDMEHDLYLNAESNLIEYVFPEAVNSNMTGSFTMESYIDQNTLFYFWTGSDNEDENFTYERELAQLPELQKKYQDTIRIVVITSYPETVISKILKSDYSDMQVVVDSSHKNTFNYQTPISVFYSKNGNLEIISYSTYIMEYELDKLLFGVEEDYPELSMIWSTKYPLKRYEFPAPFNSDIIGAFKINDLLKKQTVIYIWPTLEDCYFCLSDLILANRLYHKYKSSIQFVVISQLSQSTIEKVLKEHNIDIPFVVDSGHRKVFPSINPWFFLYDTKGELRDYGLSAHIVEERLEMYFKDGVFK
ncbi:MAG: redoxin domain-containing protein [Cyclobacteriaceae bacterium]